MKTNIRSILGLFKNNWHLKIASVFIAIVVLIITTSVIASVVTKKEMNNENSK